MPIKKQDAAYRGRPFTGAWIETRRCLTCPLMATVAPSRGRGLKLDGKSDAPRGEQVAPSRGRGLKLPSRHTGSIRPLVAPSRGRGLKPPAEKSKVMLSGRPFTGAWIETPAVRAFLNWSIVAPSRGRGLKRPWWGASSRRGSVAPSRGRGLKQWWRNYQRWPGSGSPLHGGVD